MKGLLYMTSKDNTFDMSKIELLFREHFARIDKQFAEMKADNAEFKITIINEMNKRFEGVNSRFDGLQTQINTIQNDITGLKHDVANLFHWNYWILAIIIGVFVLPNVADFIRSLFGLLHDGIAGSLALFKRERNN